MLGTKVVTVVIDNKFIMEPEPHMYKSIVSFNRLPMR